MHRGAGWTASVLFAWGAPVLLAAGCGSEATTPPPPTTGGASTLPVATRSGARLEARFESLGPAAEIFQTFFDKKLGVDCSVQTASDGIRRCLPTDTLSADDVFADFGCEKRLVTAAKVPCKTSKFASVSPTCPLATNVYAIGAAVTPSIVFSRGTTGECASQAVDATTSYFELGAELPPTDFVGVTPKLFTEDGFQTVMLDGEDGSRGFGGFRDAKRDAECAPRTMTDNSVRCVPVQAATVDGTVFGDAQCAVRASATSACKDPIVAVEADTCGGRAKVFAIGPLAKDAFGGGKGTCTPLGPSPRVFSLGPEIAPKDLVPMIDVPPPRDFRIVAVQWSAPGGPITRGLFDTEKRHRVSGRPGGGRKAALPAHRPRPGPLLRRRRVHEARRLLFVRCGAVAFRLRIRRCERLRPAAAHSLAGPQGRRAGALLPVPR